jgi:hypothetical protein
MPDQRSFGILLVVWTLLGLAGLACLQFMPNGARLRAFVPWYVGVCGVLLLGVGAALGFPVVLLVVVVPLLTLFMYVQLRRLQFCDGCGRTVPRLRPLSEPEFCYRCGASLRL